MGLMQLMPATARRFQVDDPYEPTANLDGGARYLRYLLNLFDDLKLALAAYNAGENAVLRHGKAIPPYPETRRYVTKVLGYYAYFQTLPG
jgi:soluble lytic murein transglycosylase-like protein